MSKAKKKNNKITVPKVNRKKSEIDSFKKVLKEIEPFKSKRVIAPYTTKETWQKAK